ncbi:alkaline phosphatase PhoX [Streptomyces aidingensis]|uniref:WD40-like Beta Propeller Repeat n=1 Tax=Streptomyces aidingensis TaxID=910347 RepID=A0A1I1LJ17_9ACTN|nr:alkaline phosphatase PhoX [Streptomyces aidingensis]SFC70323.1 WD40-like Beta Propeller Repeat [Streptomyces aidingensis]
MQRRTFLRATSAGAGAVALCGTLWQGAAAHAASSAGTPASAGPYGPLLPPGDLGVAVPRGFSVRVVARSSHWVRGILWHPAPDGGACFPDGDGWIYVSNSEIPLIGGASALRFRPDGTVDRAYRILSGTTLNCAGGATPWRTWLSCEETFRGRVFETDPYGRRSAVAHPAMGRFKHEAAACDPDRRVVYLTEDEGDGCFYRYTPHTWGELDSGRLDVLCESSGGGVEWRQVPDPSGPVFGRQTRHQVSAALHFDGGEGCHYHDGVCYFTTKGDNRVWAYDAEAGSLGVAYDSTGPLDGVDNITGTAGGDLYVAEDGGNMEINVITPQGVVAPVVRIDGQEESEITGPAFSPDGTRLYFSSQRGTSGNAAGLGGITYEMSGPFRH